MQVWLDPLRLQQVLVKPRNTETVQWRREEGRPAILGSIKPRLIKIDRPVPQPFVQLLDCLASKQSDKQIFCQFDDDDVSETSHTQYFSRTTVLIYIDISVWPKIKNWEKPRRRVLCCSLTVFPPQILLSLNCWFSSDLSLLYANTNLLSLAPTVILNEKQQQINTNR